MMWTNNQPQVFVQNCHPSSWNDGLLGSFKIQSHFACGNSPTALSTRSLLLTHTELQSLWKRLKKNEPSSHSHSRPFTRVHFILWAFDFSFLNFFTWLAMFRLKENEPSPFPESLLLTPVHSSSHYILSFRFELLNFLHGLQCLDGNPMDGM